MAKLSLDIVKYNACVNTLDQCVQTYIDMVNSFFDAVNADPGWEGDAKNNYVSKCQAEKNKLIDFGTSMSTLVSELYNAGVELNNVASKVK